MRSNPAIAPAQASRGLRGSALAGRLLRVRPYEVELLRPALRVAPLSWLLLAAGALAAAAAAWVLQPQLARRAELSQQQERLESALERLGAPASAGAGARSRASQHEAADEARQVAAELRRPWHELFEQLEAAAAADDAAVHVVQVSVEPRFATVQLVAEGRDLGKLVRFTQRLTGGAPIRSMTLTHYEWRDALGGHVLSASLQGDLAAAPGPAPLALAAAPAPKEAP